MTKLEFILKQLAKTNKKNYENYVVTRIWHTLNDLDIKFITQQYVTREVGKYALTDMFFPQFNLHIEVDELHHANVVNIREDEVREKDIIHSTGHEIIRVRVVDGMDEIHNQVQKIVEKIKVLKNEIGENFVPWDIEKEISPQTYIDLGYIQLKDNVAFHRSFEACNCFGYDYKGLFKGGAKHPIEDNVTIWFPKLYPNEDWDNSISSDGMIIREKHIDPVKAEEHINNHINSGVHKRIVFARVKGPLGDIMYRFKGAFRLDINMTRDEGNLYWVRYSDEVKTYAPLVKNK
ncbi:phosphoribosylaminoimidazole carboxylase [Neobacillus drentensis]|uniref:AbaSI family restriction endonuclease n=1 Tax=Neobacillus drentensis TaxID=220684 RepID=UPI00300289A2